MSELLVVSLKLVLCVTLMQYFGGGGGQGSNTEVRPADSLSITSLRDVPAQFSQL